MTPGPGYEHVYGLLFLIKHIEIKTIKEELVNNSCSFDVTGLKKKKGKCYLYTH